MIERKKVLLKPNPKRVIIRIYNTENKETVERITKSVADLDEEAVKQLFNEVYTEFGDRHRDLKKVFDQALSEIAHHAPEIAGFSDERKYLLGSYFTKEYSIEAAALFNPSIVPHPDQTDVPEDSRRILMSLRGAGEGHISCVELVSGTMDDRGNIEFDPNSKYAALPDSVVVNRDEPDIYEIVFDSSRPPSERIIFPQSADERNGIEDIRFVRFHGESESTYYGTYTAYDGKNIKSKLMETSDFVYFKIYVMKGRAINDKGMALFPRKLNGQYAMISRQDSENLRLMYSDDLLKWDDSEIIQRPELPWQFAKLGNCGSPMETGQGWLLPVHGVGPVRKYTIGFYLLDLENPAKILGRTTRPLLSPNQTEREGYVPNVVYSCGCMIHNNYVVIPYAMSDSATGIATIETEKLIAIME